jgi:hypothetical protein
VKWPRRPTSTASEQEERASGLTEGSRDQCLYHTHALVIHWPVGPSSQLAACARNGGSTGPCGLNSGVGRMQGNPAQDSFILFFCYYFPDFLFSLIFKFQFGFKFRIKPRPNLFPNHMMKLKYKFIFFFI